MAGIQNPNAPTSFYDAQYIAARSTEIPSANWQDGLNRGGSCSNGIGINTGDYNPKNQDWWRANAPEEAISGYIGIDSGPQGLVTALDINDGQWKRVAFVQPNSDTPDGGVLINYLATDVINRTGETVPNGQWVWGIMST
jgi:hypothetical protein